MPGDSDVCSFCDGSGLHAYISARTVQTGESEFAPCSECHGSGLAEAPVPVHSVTLGELFVETGSSYFPFMRPATIADLVSALRAEGVLVIQKVNGDWPDWLTDVDGPIWHQCGQTWGLLDDIFDALAEAQPFPPAGGVL